MIILLLSMSFSAFAQSFTVSGIIKDAFDDALPGVSVLVKGTTTGTVSSVDGSYQITVPNQQAILQFSYIGFLPQEHTVGNRTTINVIMREDMQLIEEVVVVGYGMQRKATLTGAVVAVKSDDIVITRNENVQNMLTGKLPGLRVVQRSAEPGAFNNHLDIRGMGTPLIIIDGVPRTMEEFQRMDPNDIDNVSILKDASAAIYGVRAANGVMLVTTKKGSITEGKPKLNYSNSFTMQVPSGLPATLDAVEYMTLRNELTMRNVNGGIRGFTDEQIDEYRKGLKESVNWHDLVFAKWAPQTQHNLSATGGTDRTTYYVGLGYQFQEGFFKSRDMTYNRYNVRVNLSTKITNRLTFDISMSGTSDSQQRAWQGTDWIIRAFWRQGPLVPPYADPDKTMLYHGLVEGDNPLAWMSKDISGYRRYGKNYFSSSAGLKYEVPGIRGLELKGLVSYDYYQSNDKFFRKEHAQYRYNEATNTYTKWLRQSPDRLERETDMRNQVLLQGIMSYDRVFGIQKVSGALIWEAQKRDADNFYARRNLAFPLDYLHVGVALNQEGYIKYGNDDYLYSFSNNALAGRFNYAYADKYLVDLYFRYDGSSKFTKQKQWGFFPAMSAAWRISEEEFFNTSFLSVFDQFKLRYSLGKTGDDTPLAYQFFEGYNYPSTSDARRFTGGYVFDGAFVNSATNRGIPNQFITWQTATTWNIGLDFEIMRGRFGATFEYFNRLREGQFARRSQGIPTVVGATMPQENLNSDKHFGAELVLTHRNRIGDLRYDVSANATITRQKRLHVDRNPDNSSWNNWRENQNNRLQGIHRGRQADGRYLSWDDLWNSPVYTERGWLPGDYRYLDWNGDGEVNDLDVHPIRFNQHPWINFGMLVNAAWKGIDASLQFHGSALASWRYNESLREPLWGNDNSSGLIYFYDRWHPEDTKADPWDTTIKWVQGAFPYTRAPADYNSAHNAISTSYLRLKTIEIGYTLPLPGSLGIQNLRIFANSYNLLTISKAKYFDPEHPEDSWGNVYPLNKTFSLGLNLTF